MREAEAVGAHSDQVYDGLFDVALHLAGVHHARTSCGRPMQD